MAGYSGTPLPQKLGIKTGHVVGLDGPPPGFASTLGPLPEGARLVPAGRGKTFDVLLLFVRNEKSLTDRLEPSVARMEPETSLWVCWPKKTSPLASDVNENTVRARGLAAGVVDVKICAVDEDWSGLKFVYRLQDRPKVAEKKSRLSKRGQPARAERARPGGSGRAIHGGPRESGRPPRAEPSAGAQRVARSDERRAEEARRLDSRSEGSEPSGAFSCRAARQRGAASAEAKSRGALIEERGEPLRKKKK